jgi:hypothetical protein
VVDRHLLNIGLESAAVRLRSGGARMLGDSARWLVVPVMLTLSALMAQAAVAGVDYFGRNYPHMAHQVPDRSPLGTFFVVLSVVALVAALAVAARLTQLLVERFALSHYRRTLRTLTSTDAGALIAGGGLWDALSGVLDSVSAARLIGARPLHIERQLALAAAYMPLLDAGWLSSKAVTTRLYRGGRLWMAHSLPVQRACQLSGWLLVVFGLPCVIGLSFTQPVLGTLSATALALLGIVQVATYAEYCGNLAALCDWFRGELPARPRIWH